jgi:hypothetical protein
MEAGFADLFCPDLWFPDLDGLELVQLDVDGFGGLDDKDLFSQEISLLRSQ